MPLEVGSSIAHYSVTALIGEGGMGQVYQATDTKLNRQVALKIIPEASAADPDRLARFEREAKVLASLNHPGIAGIYGLEEQDGTKALVLELVEGPTLADRIAQGPIPVDEALPIAKQISEALEAAHEQGIIHRDLKPANIKLRPDGTVKVLDFGLAKALDPRADGDPRRSPTLTMNATQGGVIMGTAAYMAPEQARGRPVDKRADNWAFGVVLFEMLAGARVFEGDDVSETLARVIEREPAWTRLPASMSPVLGAFLRLCLEKDAARRLRDLGDIGPALDGSFEAMLAVLPESRRPSSPPWWRPALLGLCGVVAGAALAGVGLSSVTSQPPRTVTHLTVGATVPFDPLPEMPSLAISPDGTHVVYRSVDDETQHLYLRPLDQPDGRSLVQSTELLATPFFSPDSAWVGFFEGGTWKKVPVQGGQPLTLFTKDPESDPDAPSAGGSWGADDVILFPDFRGAGPLDPSWGGRLWRGPGTGGTPEVVAAAEARRAYMWPDILPGERAALLTRYTVTLTAMAERNVETDKDVVVLDLTTGEETVIVPGGSTARYAVSGHVVYGENGTLWAVPFDLDTLRVSGRPVPVVEGVLTHGRTGALEFALSKEGALVYATGTPPTEGFGRLVWLDPEDGGIERATEPIFRPRYLRLSPDGQRVALTAGLGSRGDLWVYGFDGRRPIPLTDEGHNIFPVWSPDGVHLVFRSTGADGETDLFWLPSDGSGVEPEVLPVGPGVETPISWSSVADEVIFVDERATVGDLLAVPFDGSREPRVVVGTPDDDESFGRLSPDGRWLAYTSDRMGRRDVYVRPYSGSGAPVPVSSSGGVGPVWAPEGDALYFLEGARLMVAPIEGQPELRAGSPRMVVEDGVVTDPTTTGYDVAPDGRILMVQAADAPGTGDQPEIAIKLNWYEELRRLAPAGR